MRETTPKIVKFYEYVQPGFQDGNYSLISEQDVSLQKKVNPTSKTYTRESRFTAQGPRFSLDPGNLVSVFPPPFSLGEYTNVVPHVVLARNTLPWERSLGSEVAGSDPPWLGVILFDEDDPAPAIQEKTLLDLLPKDEETEAGKKGLLSKHTYYAPFPLKKDSKVARLDFGETWSDQCYVVDVPVSTFNQIMSTADDLGWLAHVREIELANKSETYVRRLRIRLNEDSDPVGQVAEVIGNRFPLPGKKSVAHLVCLEGFGPVLPDPSGQSNLPSDVTHVRLVSLSNWTFSTVSQDYTFAGLLRKVNYVNGVFTQDTLQVPFTSAEKASGDTIVANAFSMGFTAFDHNTRLGDKTVSWFHGPFVPYDLQTDVPFPGNVADQFTRYNPDSGMFNVSYSAAWQIGRLLGLQTSNYATALYNWKRQVTQAVIDQVELEFLNFSHSEMVGLLQHSLLNYVEAQTSPAELAARAKVRKKATKPLTMIKPNRLAAIRKTLADHRKIHALLMAQGDGPDVPGAVTSFLARLRLLYGIPFNYLVPDERALPPESMRFFYVDNAWVDCLLEGALSIGNATSSDAQIGQALAPVVRAQVHAHARNIRRSVLKMPARADASIKPGPNPTGFLLRSQVVMGWPGMEVVGYDAKGVKLEFLRLEQVGPGVLLCIFDGVAQEVEIHEQPEALHFGVDEDLEDPSPKKFTKSFRYITAVDGHQPGTPVDATPLTISPDYIRNPISSVLQIDKLAKAIQSALKQDHVYDGSFTSAEYALEMIEGVLQVRFTFAKQKGVKRNGQSKAQRR